jgi:CubicO group peptidase (beta-lactamase class C family)
MRLLLFLAGSLSGALLPTPAQANCPSPADTTGLTATLRQLWQASALPGFAVAIVRPEGIVYEQGFGYANKARHQPYTATTVQGVGSVSKTLLGIALLQTQAAGQLSLDQPVNELLPFPVVNPYFPTQPITLRHLATMTAGLTDDQSFYNRRAYTQGTSSALNSAEYLRRTLTPTGRWYRRKRFLPHAPGSYYAYSNESAALAALAIERVTGQPYDVYTRQHILEPMGAVVSNRCRPAAARHPLYSPRPPGCPLLHGHVCGWGLADQHPQPRPLPSMHTQSERSWRPLERSATRLIGAAAVLAHPPPAASRPQRT